MSSNAWDKWYSNPENRKKHIAKSKRNEKLARVEKRKFIQEKKNRPCTDCGIKYDPWVMQFDHVAGEKINSVANMTGRGYSIKKIAEEMDKCEVVCSNCHATRTHNRAFGVIGNTQDLQS